MENTTNKVKEQESLDVLLKDLIQAVRLASKLAYYIKEVINHTDNLVSLSKKIVILDQCCDEYLSHIDKSSKETTPTSDLQDKYGKPLFNIGDKVLIIEDNLVTNIVAIEWMDELNEYVYFFRDNYNNLLSESAIAIKKL